MIPQDDAAVLSSAQPLDYGTPYHADTQAKKARWLRRRIAWLSTHWKAGVVVTSVLMIVGGASAVNMNRFPMRFEDEGTYISQAWAVQHWGQLAHYTYWYDHPPLGWIQLAGWTTLTDAFDRHDTAINAGREFMLVMKLAACVLLYLLARRLGMRVGFAAAAVLLFGLSPLSVMFGRFVLLDNIAIVWVLAAFVLALSPRKHLAAVAGSAAAMAIAVLSKETTLILLPVLVYALWQHSDTRNRRYGIMLFGVVFIMSCGFYVLYAALKSELFEGAGHVSLLGAVKWQLLSREGSGSLLASGTGAHGLARLWFGTDPWLLGAGILLTPLAFKHRRLRPIGLALLIQTLFMLRPGYLPFPYIIAMLPFAALIIPGVLDAGWHKVQPGLRMPKVQSRQLRKNAMLLGILMAFVVLVAPLWQARLQSHTSYDADKSMRETTVWLDQNVPRSARLVIDSGLWVDLVRRGFINPQAVWLYKVETDPQVAGAIGGPQGVDYIALPAATFDASNRTRFPTIFAAMDKSRLVAAFGEGENRMLIYQQRSPESQQASLR